MKKLAYLIIHCTATPEGKAFVGRDIIRMHTTPPPNGRGWKTPGYSDLILLDGKVENLVPHNDDDFVDPREITNGALGLNAISRHVAYVGGTDKKGRAKNTMNPAQELALHQYVLAMIHNHPDIKVAGHRQFAAKACPSFDTIKWLEAKGIPSKNIHR